MKDFVEMRVLGAVRGLLSGRVNEVLGEMQFAIPLVELGEYRGASVVVPVVSLSTCERSEKERLLKIDAYALNVSFAVPESEDSELFCYAYGAAVERALGGDVTLGGVADRVVLVGKKYLPPKKPGCGGDWEIVLTLRVTIENPLPCGFSI